MTTRRFLSLAILSSAVGLWPQRALAQTSSQAATVPDTRILSDPLFLPRQGQVYGVTAYTRDMPSGDNFKVDVATASFTASDNLFEQTIAYGLFDNLTIAVSDGYGVNHRTSTAASTGDVTTTSARGFNDPTITATFRVLDEPRAPLVLDVSAAYSPDLIASKSAGAGGGDSTIARGGQATSVSLALGRVTRSFTIAGTFDGTYAGQVTTDVLSNDTSREADAHWHYSVGVATQTRVADRVSLDVGASLATSATYVVSNVDTGSSHTTAPADTRALNLALNYQFLPNRVVGQFAYSYDNDTTSTNTFAKASSDTSVKNRMGSVFGVRLFYTFR